VETDTREATLDTPRDDKKEESMAAAAVKMAVRFAFNDDVMKLTPLRADVAVMILGVTPATRAMTAAASTVILKT
jgi:hypothetical protein